MSAALRAALASVDQELVYLTTRVEHLRAARTSLAALCGEGIPEPAPVPTLDSPIPPVPAPAPVEATVERPAPKAVPTPTRDRGKRRATYGGGPTKSSAIVALTGTITEPMSMPDLAKHLGTSEGAARQAIVRLRRAGLVQTGWDGGRVVLLPFGAPSSGAPAEAEAAEEPSDAGPDLEKLFPECATLEEIGAELGVSKERARQLVAKASIKFRRQWEKMVGGEP